MYNERTVRDNRSRRATSPHSGPFAWRLQPRAQGKKSNDIDLLQEWRSGDVAAGDELFRRHVETLYRFFSTKVSGGVDDLVQQTMIACLENQRSFEQRSSFRAFLLGVARFQLCSHYRNSKRDNARLEFDSITLFDLDPSPSTHAAENSEQQLLLAALRRLPVNLQIALELSYWEDMTGPELAEALGIPTDTVYSRLRRARELLARNLKRLSDAGKTLEPTQINLETWAAAMRSQLSRPTVDDDDDGSDDVVEPAD